MTAPELIPRHNKLYRCRYGFNGGEQICLFVGYQADGEQIVRLGYMSGRLKDDVSDGGHALHENYKAMAEANGVDPSDPVLAPCRD